MPLENFYSVESSVQQDNSYSTTLRINKNHQIYAGHFPKRPVTPGVILMQLFKEELERLSKHELQLEKAFNVKFTAVVDPNIDENIILHSTFEENDENISLKGTAENNKATALKISAVYKILK